MKRQIMVPIEDVHTLRVGSVGEFLKRLEEAKSGHAGPPKKVHKSACQLFGLPIRTMRDLAL